MGADTPRESAAPTERTGGLIARSEPDIATQLQQLLAAHMHARRFVRGELLWREGETSGLLVALRVGRVKIYRLLPNGRSVTLLLFGPGDVFGFLPFLDGGAYPAYAQAMEPVQADVMPRAVFERVLAAEPSLAIQLVTLLGRRLREAFDVIQSVSTPGAQSRVAAALLGLLSDEGPAGGRAQLSLPMSAHEFADAIGIAPETFSRAITELAAQGVIRRVRPGRYELRDLAGLERAARSPLR